MDETKIKQEFLKCKADPVYFISNYIKVVHPMRGLVKFDLYPFQKRILKEFKKYRFNILRKFRQAGCTTLVSAYSLWLNIFRPYTTIAILSKGDVESTEVIDRIRIMHSELPDWLRPTITEDNKHTLKFENGSVIKSRASGKQSGRSLSCNVLILDEAAFIEQIDTIWAAVYPVISTGGAVIALSTVNGVGNWFHKYYTDAFKKLNMFNAIDINWKDHPEYKRHPGYEKLYEQMLKYEPPINIDDWEATTRRNLPPKQWLQEYECEFLGTGDTYIDGQILKLLKENVNHDYWTRYNNRLRIWKDPLPYHEYALGIDTAIGRERDYSAFNIIDIYNGEQVAEFYSNTTPINEFAKIIANEARRYNTAFVLPERNTIGHNLIYFLFQELEYENLVMGDDGEFGIQVAQKNREMLLADMEDAIRSGRVKINSERLVDELLTLIIDPDTNKIEPDVNCHADLIIALALSVNIFKLIRATTPIEQYRPYDYDNNWKPPIVRTKYNVKTATGGISEEDITWLITGR